MRSSRTVSFEHDDSLPASPNTESSSSTLPQPRAAAMRQASPSPAGGMAPSPSSSSVGSGSGDEDSNGDGLMQAAMPGSPRSMVRAYFGENPWDKLHAAPTFYVIITCMLFSTTCTYILDQHVLSTKDHVGTFLMGSYVVFSSYFVIYFFLEKYSTSFRKISRDKKFYTISNLIKAGILSSITPFAVWQLYRIVVFDEWDTNTLRNLGCVYSIPDFVAMLVVKRMAWTTRAHHMCVVLFNYFSIQNDYQNVNVCRLIVVYAAFSTFAYCVNMLLASRFLGVSQKVSKYLSLASLGVYMSCCAINWAWQVHYLRRLVIHHDHWTIYLYMMLICFVMWDDIILNRWLLMNVKNTSGLGGARVVLQNTRGSDAAATLRGINKRAATTTFTRRGRDGARARQNWYSTDALSTAVGRLIAVVSKKD